MPVVDFFETELKNDGQWSENWQYLNAEEINKLPDNTGGLFIVRATRDGQPIPIEHGPNNVELGGIIYIKGADNLKFALLALKRSLDDRDTRHPAAANYYNTDGHAMYPLEGLQFRYTLIPNA